MSAVCTFHHPPAAKHLILYILSAEVGRKTDLIYCGRHVFLPDTLKKTNVPIRVDIYSVFARIY